ncbi:seipin-like isoform X2 [Thalassophryne amazonica]|uniref:seipin-like isoform X2 n=1 Tax=Thalassophryne amazonica TaxID=390379 RepID=UPI0014719302|nr:seipin-like isoform X2 [Thalassophryne amazonica]
MDGEHEEPLHQKTQPLLIGRKLLQLRVAFVLKMLRVRKTLLQSFIVFFTIVLLLWTAAFLYGSFYYSFIPGATYSTPVHYYYRTDCETPDTFWCSYPVANISLMKNNKHVLKAGQAYRISLQLDMPDSPVNHELGMFMIKTTFYSRDGQGVTSSALSARQLLSTSSARFSMLRYRSHLLRTIGTLMFLPALLSGVAEEKQVLQVELFSDYTPDPYGTTVWAIIEIPATKVQIYSSQLYIHAQYTGIRYLLFNFPVLSAVVGVSSNFIFLSAIFIFSYTRLLLKQPLQVLHKKPKYDRVLVFLADSSPD